MPTTRSRVVPPFPWLLEADLEKKRELISSAQGRFCGVTFYKKDGSERRMQVQPAALRLWVKGDRASERARRATETRELCHPHLFPVWDVRAKAPRSINLATVSRIAVDGKVHRF